MGAVSRVFKKATRAVGDIVQGAASISSLGLVPFPGGKKPKSAGGGGPGLPAPKAIATEVLGPTAPEKVKITDVPKTTATKTTGRKRRQNIKTTPFGLSNIGLLSAKKKLLGQ